jgi:putative ABC transport system permease protein
MNVSDEYLTRQAGSDPATAARWQLGRWLLAGEWRLHRLRALVAISAIAVGVALGFAIHLINAAAFNEFSAAVKSLSGQSDLQVRAAQPFFDEALYPRLAQYPGVAVASPVLEIDATLPSQTAPPTTLTILGIDIFRAAQVTPDLIGVAAAGADAGQNGKDNKDQQDQAARSAMLADDAIFLSPAAMQWLNAKPGTRLTLRTGAGTATGTVTLRVAGGLLRARAGQRLAVMDIAALQWRFGRLGQISRIDLKLADGVNLDAFKQGLQREFGGRLMAVQTDDQEARSANMSRAYRVNLNVLALVALFTGAFLVFSSQALAVLRRRTQFALLRVLGMTRRQLLAQVLAEGALLGVLGAVLGLVGGYAMAAAALHFFGGDLGGGYFAGVRPGLSLQPAAAATFLLLGLAVALLGSAAPAWEAARARPAQALKAGSEDSALSRLATPWPALLLLALGAACTRLPPVWNLPLFGYLAVALLLIGAIALMPRCAAWLFGLLSARMSSRTSSSISPSMPPRAGAGRTVATLALARLANAPNQAAVALGGVLSSFSLMVAMAIMVSSFRVSVDDWLSHILPADLYLRSGAVLQPAQQQAIAATPGLLRADFLRSVPLLLKPAQPPVMLIARPIDAAAPERMLPIVGPVLPPAAIRGTPIWVSEAMLDLYGYQLGSEVSLPLQTGAAQASPVFTVAGVWRDYARQTGSIQMRLADYRALSGDATVNDAALWLAPDTSPAQLRAALRRLPFGATLEFSEPGQIRAVSLKIFDRSFAVTYLLEAVAVLIGLFGVGATVSAQTLARTTEFGMLRHIGVTRGQVLALLATEGALVTALGILAGFVLGWCISLILVFIVNPQSFHWSMQMHIPWTGLASVALILLACATLTALLAGRHAVAGSAIRAVREDW